MDAQSTSPALGPNRDLAAEDSMSVPSPTMEMMLSQPQQYSQVMLQEAASSACRPGSTSPCRRNGRSQGPRQPCCPGRTQASG